VVRLSAGYQFIRYFALEAGYARLGSYSNNIDMDCSGSPQVQCIPDFRSDIDVQNFGLYSVGILPIGDRLSLRAAVGFSLRERKTHQVPVGAPDYTRHSQDVRVAFGIGAGFAVTKRMDVYAEWSKLDGSGDHPFPTGEQLNPGTVAVEAAIEVFSLGARLRF
jgi:hypothetical protein